MEVFSHVFAVLALISIVLLMASLFTPKTAFLFKEKTKSKGTGIWLSSVFFCFFMIGVFVPEERQEGGVPAFGVQVAHTVPGLTLSLDCVIAQPVDEATLSALGLKAYADHNGKGYKDVFIMWYLPHYTKGSGVWGMTNFSDGTISVRIMALQG